ncbi:helix-turn-helix transcriptional regulator [Polaromonas sp. P5_D5]
MVHTILRLRAVLQARGVCRSSHYAQIAQGLFTPPVAIGRRAVGWPQAEVEALNAARIAGKNDAEVRLLVQCLKTKRLAAVGVSNPSNL